MKCLYRCTFTLVCFELEFELIQFHLTQKPVLRGQVDASALRVYKSLRRQVVLGYLGSRIRSRLPFSIVKMPLKPGDQLACPNARYFIYLTTTGSKHTGASIKDPIPPPPMQQWVKYVKIAQDIKKHVWTQVS